MPKPTKTSTRDNDTAPKARSSFAIDAELHRMAKTIASMEGRTVRELVDHLVASYIVEYVTSKRIRLPFDMETVTALAKKKM